MRGKAKRQRFLFRNVRITPAYAGKSLGGIVLHFDVRDHPRLCGEKCFCWCILFCDVGSPPPMRGKDIPCDQSANRHRITPAYAGKSHRQTDRRCILQDHPRLCGEKRQQECRGVGSLGSPPPMRGKALDRVFGWRGVRDHPRLCGEKDKALDGVRRASGSPPPMRGKVSIRLNLPRYTGITPAYAGKRVISKWSGTTSKDHPRLCGEKVSGRTQQQRRRRITPAYAGKSWRSMARK